jgi:ELWxxDGT repeat protein
MKKKSFIGLLFFILFQSSFAQNPELFKDIAPFPFGSKPGSFAVLGSKLIFAANNYVGSSTNRELFVSDGTPNGTQLLLDLNAGNSSSSPEKMINLYGKVYFAVADNSFGPLVYRPWVTDGTVAGTIPLFPNPINALGSTLGIISLFKPEDLFVAYKGSVYFKSFKPTPPYNSVIYKPMAPRPVPALLWNCQIAI